VNFRAKKVLLNSPNVGRNRSHARNDRGFPITAAAIDSPRPFPIVLGLLLHPLGQR